MGRMSGIESKRRRNNAQKRRLKIGLITVSVLVLCTLLFFGVKLIRSVKEDKTAAPEIVASNSDILVESDYYLSEYGAPGDTYEITADTGISGTVPLGDTKPGVVTPSSALATWGGTVTLKATANPGFTFTRWVDKNGAMVSQNSVLTVSDIKASEKYTAMFILSAVNMKYRNIYKKGSTEIEGAGYIQNEQDYLPYVSDSNENRSASLSCTAVPAPGYVFDRWTITTDEGMGGANPTSGTSADIRATFPIDNSDAVISATLTAEYKKSAETDACTLAVQPSGVAYVIAGNKATGLSGSDPVTNGASYAINSTKDYGYYVFTVITLEDSGSNPHELREVLNVDTGDVYHSESSGVVYWNRESTPDDTHAYLVRIKEKGNYVIKIEHNGSFWHMGAIVTVASPADGGITNGDMTAATVNSTITTTLNATPNRGYMFDHWEYYDVNGELCVSSKQQLPVAMSGFHIFTAVFVEDMYEVKAVCDPEDGGTVSGTGKYRTHSDATVTATPQPGYKFDKWTWKNKDGDSFEEKTESVTIRDIEEDYHLTAHFKKANPYVTVSVNELGTGTSNPALYNYAKLFDGSAEYVTSGPSATPAGTVTQKLQNGTSVTLQAFPNDLEGYQFVYWVDQDGNTNSSNPYTVGEVKDDANYIAVFTKKKDKYVIKAVPDPVDAKVATGTFTITVADPVDTSKTSTFNDEGNADPHYNATITPLPNTGYTFKKWTWRTADGLDHESYDSTLAISDIMEDYTLIGHFYKNDPTVKVTVSPTDEKDGVFNCASITDTAGNTIQTPASGTAQLVVNGDESVTLQAFPNANNDYLFSYWVDKDGNTNTANPLVVGKIAKDQEYTAIFTKKQDKYEVKLVSDPDEGGILTGDGKYDIHENVVVTAVNNPGYSFDKWTWKTVDGAEHESTNASLIITDIHEDHVVTAHFIKDAPEVTVKAEPVDEKDGSYNYAEVTDNHGNSGSTGSGGSIKLDVQGGEAVTLQAFPNDNNDYVFSYWVDKDGNTTAANPYVVGKIAKDQVYTAVFTKKKDKYEVKLVSDPDEGGTLTGAGKYDAHSSVTVTATPNSGYVFDRWTWKTVDGAEHNSHETSVTISDIMEDHVLTAHFLESNPRINVNVSPVAKKDGGYNYVEITDTEGHFASTDSGGSTSLDVSGGATVTLKAIANTDAHYKFVYWVDQDGNVNNSNPYVIGKVSKEMTYTAIFTTDDENDKPITVLASPPSGGKVSADKNDDGGYDISAETNRGYTFLRWECVETEKTVTAGKSFTISEEEAAKGYTYIAYFKIDKGVKITSDLIWECFPNVRRLFAQPKYEYTRESWISRVTTFINGYKEEEKPATGTPVAYSALSRAETVMVEKAEDAKTPEITAHSELITTQNEIIPISSATDYGDAYKEAGRIRDQKFGSHYSFDIICVKNVTAPADFVDGTRTYLWYNTGAKQEDNLFIIYDLNNKEEIVTPVSDYEGTLTFTIDKLGDTNRFVLVRVEAGGHNNEL